MQWCASISTYADDFATIGSSGKIITKKELLRDFESFHDKLESFESGPMDVQVFGNVAVVHGGVMQTRRVFIEPRRYWTCANRPASGRRSLKSSLSLA
jgi:hypothetical protein